MEAKGRWGVCGYAPGDLLKAYIYGYLNRVRSSRRLETEVIATSRSSVVGGLKPDFKTIADFRRDNRTAFRAVFRQFVLLCRRLDLYGRELLADDGTASRRSTTRIATSPALRCEEFIRRADEWLEDYAQAAWTRAMSRTARQGGGARTKNLVEKIAAPARSAAVTC